MRLMLVLVLAAAMVIVIFQCPPNETWKATTPRPVNRTAGATITEDACAKRGHNYGPWFKQSQMFYLPEQPAHVCTVCGSFQNSSGRFMELVGKEIPGGLGTLTLKEAEAQADREILKDFGTWEDYEAATARDGYRN